MACRRTPNAVRRVATQSTTKNRDARQWARGRVRGRKEGLTLRLGLVSMPGAFRAPLLSDLLSLLEERLLLLSGGQQRVDRHGFPSRGVPGHKGEQRRQAGFLVVLRLCQTPAKNV